MCCHFTCLVASVGLAKPLRVNLSRDLDLFGFRRLSAGVSPRILGDNSRPERTFVGLRGRDFQRKHGSDLLPGPSTIGAADKRMQQNLFARWTELERYPAAQIRGSASLKTPSLALI
jgi:hypothetical protein